MNADEKNALRNEATASVASMGPNAKAMLLSSDILRYLDEIDRLEAENVEVRSRLSAMPHDGGHATTCWIWGEGPMRGHEGNPGGVCSCGYLWLYWRGRAEEAEAKIEKPSLSTPNQEM